MRWTKKCEALDRVIKYLAKHEGAGHMRYARAKRAGEPIGTGITAAAAKTLQVCRKTVHPGYAPGVDGA